jgi:hypothetical protein
MGRSHSILKAPDEIQHNASTKLQHDISHRIPFSPITPRKRNLPFASNKEPTKKQCVRSDRNSNNINNNINNQVAKSNTFKTSNKSKDGLQQDKRDIVGTAMERSLQQMPPFYHSTDTPEDIVETVNSEILLHLNSHFPFSLHDDGSNLHSDDGDGTSKERAFERVLTNHQAPIIGRKRAISVMAIDIDNYHKKRKISSECVPKWTPDEATLPLCTNITTLPTTAAELYATFFRTPPEHITPFFNHHIKEVIRDGTLVLPGTPPGTNCRHPPGTSASAHMDENAIIHGDKPNCPAPADGIGPMSERDHNAENAVNPNFNDNISDNGLTVANISATNSIYSQCSENSRNCVHLYVPELTRAFDTTHTSTTDGTRTKPITEIFVKNFQDKDAEFPTRNSPPTTHDPLETTILVQTRTQTKSAFRHPATKNYAAIDIVKNKGTRFSIPHQFSNSKTAAPISCNPLYFIPISEEAHKLRNILHQVRHLTHLPRLGHREDTCQDMLCYC